MIDDDRVTVAADPAGVVDPPRLGGGDGVTDGPGDVDALVHAPPARAVLRGDPVLQGPAHGVRRDHDADGGAVDPRSVTVERLARPVEADPAEAVPLGGLEFDRDDPVVHDGRDRGLGLLEGVDLLVQQPDALGQRRVHLGLTVSGGVEFGQYLGLLAPQIVHGPRERIERLPPPGDLLDGAVEALQQLLVVLADHGEQHVAVLEVVNVGHLPREGGAVLGGVDVHVDETLGRQPPLGRVGVLGASHRQPGRGVEFGAQHPAGGDVGEAGLRQRHQVGRSLQFRLEFGGREP